MGMLSFQWLEDVLPDIDGIREVLGQAGEGATFFTWFTTLSRFAVCLLSLFIVFRCIASLLSSKQEPEIWGYLNFREIGRRLPLKHWENTIGRARYNDVIVDLMTVSRSHAALIRDNACWKVTDLESRAGTKVNGRLIFENYIVKYGDALDFGGAIAYLEPLTEEEAQWSMNRTPPGIDIRPSFTIYLLSLLQIILAFQLSFAAGRNFVWMIPLSFVFLIAITWLYFLFFSIQNRRGFEIDTIAFFLATIGLSITASSEPHRMRTQFLALVLGIGFFLLMGWFLRDIGRVRFMRWPMAAAALGLLGFTILFGTVVNGAKNWIFIGSLSVQPSEIAKVAFVYAGAATLDRLFSKRNNALYIFLAASCAAALAWMSDFGAVLLFFVAFLVTAYMRSGDLTTVIFAIASAVFGSMIVVRFRPYILARFSTWLHAWQYPYDQGYQQTRTMSAAASGGFLGMGAGRGWLKLIPAADTDLVFGMVVEELGLITGICAVACIVAVAIFTAKSTITSRSAFYTIAACAASTMLVFQMTLNVLGSVDLLPLTGVTFPFVSNGGSSLVSSFGMLAFIKAIDTRQNASFASMPQKKMFRKGVRAYEKIG